MSTIEAFGRYRIGVALGKGGMATVHEAWIEGPDGFARRVALKRIRADVAGAGDLVKLFGDEARIASHLHHANLVAIVDYGVENGVAFQALELVEGTTLEALRADLESRGEAIPDAIAIHVAREVAHGLAYAHRATDANGKPLGLVHRDVSPSNVLVGWNGDVKLSDFGIAFARGRQAETAHGTARGKPSYMAPEQATRGSLDARTDLFALGCTLHFALTGKSPLEGDEVLLKMLVGEPAPLADGIAPDLRAIVAQAVAPEKRERPASADAFIEKLDAAYASRSTRDGRSELRAWLAPIAKRLRRTENAEPATRAESPSSRATVEPESSGRAGRIAFVVAFVLVLVGAAAFGGGTTPLPAPDATRTPRATTIVDTARTIDAAMPTDAPVVEPTPPPAPSSHDRSPRDPRPPPSHEPAAPPTDVAASGWIRVVAGCDAARGGEVALDGHATGDHVPTTLRASAGDHRVRVTSPSGETFERSITVTSFHTEGSPVWFRACGE